MSKNPLPAMTRAEARIAKVLEIDEARMSRGARTRLQGALKDLREVIELEMVKSTVPEGCVRLTVNLNEPTALALTSLRLSQKGRNGNPITFTETVRRCISLTKWLKDEQSEGRMILSQKPDGTKRKELVLP